MVQQMDAKYRSHAEGGFIDEAARRLLVKIRKEKKMSPFQNHVEYVMEHLESKDSLAHQFAWRLMEDMPEKIIDQKIKKIADYLTADTEKRIRALAVLNNASDDALHKYKEKIDAVLNDAHAVNDLRRLAENLQNVRSKHPKIWPRWSEGLP